MTGAPADDAQDLVPEESQPRPDLTGVANRPLQPCITTRRTTEFAYVPANVETSSRTSLSQSSMASVISSATSGACRSLRARR